MKETGSSYFDEVFRYVKEQPGDYLRLVFKKFTMFWRGYEIGNLLPYYFARQHSNILSLPWINFVLIGPLGIIGMCYAWRRWKSLFLLYSFVFVQMMTALLFFTLARYRLPVVPVLSIFAAYTLYMAYNDSRKRRWFRIAAVFILFLSAYLGLNYFEAARRHQQEQGTRMPLMKVFRYWDIFSTNWES